MEIKYVNLGDFIEPRWFNEYAYKTVEAVVQNGTINIGGKNLKFYKDEVPFPDGSEVYVRVSSGKVTLKSEEEEAKRLRRQKEEEQRQIEIAKSHEKMNAAIEFNQQFENLPFKWDVGIKDVLSGLSMDSWGDGRRKNTVQHILCLEPVKIGKFSRQEDQFLCTSASGSDGKRWSGEVAEKWHTLDGKQYTPPVTCKKCIELAQKILKK